MSLRKRFIVGGVSCVFLLLASAIFVAHHFLYPNFSGVVIVDNDTKNSQPAELPFLTRDAGHHRYDLVMTTFMNAFSPTKYYVVPDDCIREVWVNGQRINEENFVFCEVKGRVLDFGPYIVPGQNAFTFILEDKGGWGNLFVAPAYADTIFTVLRLLLISVTLLYGLFLCRIFRAKRSVYAGFLVFLSCISCWSIFNFEHAQSQNAKIDYSYLHSLDTFGELTNSIHGYQPSKQLSTAYVPPLHGWLADSVLRLGAMADRPVQLMVEDLYRLNWSILCFAFLGVGWVITLLLPRKNERLQQLTLWALVGLTPGIGYFATASAGAGGLWFALCALCMGLLIRWVARGKANDLLLAVVIINLAILADVAGLALIVGLLGAVAIRRGNGVPPSIQKILVVFGLLGVTLVWLLYLRNNESFVINIQKILQSRSEGSSDLLQSVLQGGMSFFNISFSDSAQMSDVFADIYKQAVFGGFYLQSTFDAIVYMIFMLGRLFFLCAIAGIISLLAQGRKIDHATLLFLLVIPAVMFAYTHWFGHSLPYQQLIGVAALPFAYVVLQAVRIMPRNAQWAGHLVLSTYMVTCIGIYYLFF